MNAIKGNQDWQYGNQQTNSNQLNVKAINPLWKAAHTRKSWTAVLFKANTSRMGTPLKERLGGDRWSIIMISIN
jgi:erythromycin esterase-like protein